MDYSVLYKEIYSIGSILICLTLSSFFSSAETAITSLGNQKAKYLLKTKGTAVKQLNLWLKHPGRVLTTILVFNNAVNIFTASLATVMATHYFGDSAIGIATGIVTILVLIFGEIIPKSFAKTHAEKTALFSLKIIVILEFLIRPIIKILSGFADGVVTVLSDENEKTPTMTEDELEFIVSESEKAGVIEDLKKEIIESAFDFDETRVREIMTPRTDLTAASKTDSFEDVLKLCLDTGHSRIPIYEESIDHIVGVILAKDLLAEIATKNNDTSKVKIDKIMRESFFVPESKTIMEVFKDIKRTKNHLAIIIDEYGGTAGIVTMEDILEEIVGEIQDEFDIEEEKIKKISDNTYDVLGSTTMDAISDFFELDESMIDDEEAETLGGWMTHLISEMPEVGQTCEAAGLKMEVTEVSRHRIEQARITWTPQPKTGMPERIPEEEPKEMESSEDS